MTEAFNLHLGNTYLYIYTVSFWQSTSEFFYDDTLEFKQNKITQIRTLVSYKFVVSISDEIFWLRSRKTLRCNIKTVKNISPLRVDLGVFFIGPGGGVAINILKHPICDANIWHHKTNVEIQPFWREIGGKTANLKWKCRLSISPLQWDGRSIKYGNWRIRNTRGTYNLTRTNVKAILCKRTKSQKSPCLKEKLKSCFMRSKTPEYSPKFTRARSLLGVLMKDRKFSH